MNSLFYYFKSKSEGLNSSELIYRYPDRLAHIVHVIMSISIAALKTTFLHNHLTLIGYSYLT